MARRKMRILLPVMKMKTSKQVLTSLMKTTQMGQVGIRSVLDSASRPGLRKALESQLHEYDAIETEARTLAIQRGWEVDELDPGVRLMTDMMTRFKLGGKDTDSKIAGMMIQGNTKGLIKGLQNAHRYGGQDEPIDILSQKLLDCETANILAMQSFL